MGAEQPSLEVGDGPMRSRQQLLAGLGSLAARPVLVAELRQAVVGGPTVGVDDRPSRGRGFREGAERIARGVGQNREAKPPRAAASHLDRDSAERL